MKKEYKIGRLKINLELKKNTFNDFLIAIIMYSILGILIYYFFFR
nr:MAG TPA: hypothetical protein [Caudoviricetes sp.]